MSVARPNASRLDAPYMLVLQYVSLNLLFGKQGRGGPFCDARFSTGMLWSACERHAVKQLQDLSAMMQNFKLVPEAAGVMIIARTHSRSHDMQQRPS